MNGAASAEMNAFVRIAERGSFAELVQARGTFADLVATQLAPA